MWIKALQIDYRMMSLSLEAAAAPASTPPAPSPLAELCFVLYCISYWHKLPEMDDTLLSLLGLTL